MRANHPLVISFILVCFLLPAGLVSGLASVVVSSVIDTTYGPELLPDPFFSDNPTFSMNGTSGGFSHTYHQSTSGSDFNYVNLTWSHTAGTNYSYKAVDQPPYPRCNDFILLTQDLQWTWETLPIVVITGLDYKITRIGDFESNQYWTWMFDVSRWLIDSSGNWQSCGSGDFYTQSLDDFTQVSQALQGTPRSQIFGGMVEDSEGVQEDPEDRLTFAIGLSPTIHFLDHTLAETPYLNWTGSVTLTIRGITCAAFGGVDPDTIPFPQRLGYWQSSIYTRGDAVTVAPDDYVYTVGTEGEYSTGDLDLVFQKWDMNANLLWTQQISGPEVHRGADVLISDDGSIYTLSKYRPVFGESYNASMVVTQWDSNGNQIDEMVLDTEYGGSIQSFVMDSDGNFYITGALDIGYNGSYYNTVLKCDQNLVLVWDIIVGEYPTYGSPSIAIDSNDDVYVSGFLGQMAKIDSNGNILWEKFGITSSIAIGADDYLYSLASNYGNVFVSKYNCETGAQIWNTTWGYSWHGYPIFDLYTKDIAVGADGTIWTVSSMAAGLGCDLPVVSSFDSTNGAHQWNHTWLPNLPNRAWSFFGGFCNLIAVGTGDRAFVTGSASIGPEDSSGLGVVALAVLGPSVQSGSDGYQWVLSLVAGTGVAIVAIAVLVIKRRRSA